MSNTVNRICEVTVRTAYGVSRTYPANDTARLLVMLTGRKTFNDPDIAVIQTLGYAVVWVGERP